MVVVIFNMPVLLLKQPIFILLFVVSNKLMCGNYKHNIWTIILVWKPNEIRENHADSISFNISHIPTFLGNLRFQSKTPLLRCEKKFLAVTVYNFTLNNTIK